NSIMIIICQCCCIRRRQVRYFSSFTIKIAYPHNAVNILSISMKIIIAEFIHDKKKNHETAGNADRQAKNIDQRKHFLLPEIFYRQQKIIFKHIGVFYILIFSDNDYKVFNSFKQQIILFANFSQGYGLQHLLYWHLLPSALIKG